MIAETIIASFMTSNSVISYYLPVDLARKDL